MASRHLVHRRTKTALRTVQERTLRKYLFRSNSRVSGRVALVVLLVLASVSAASGSGLAAASPTSFPFDPAQNPACPDPELVAEQASHRFTDVEASDTHAASIGCIVYYGITAGSRDGSSYDQWRAVTRWQMALFVIRAAEQAGIEIPTQDMGFADIEFVNPVLAGGVNAAASLGLMPGRAPAEFSPHEPVTREEMAGILARLLELATDEAGPINLVRDSRGAVLLTGRDGSIISSDHPFTDLDTLVDPAHESAIAAMYALGVTQGTGNDTYEPDGMVNRAQMASFIVRVLGHTGIRPAGFMYLKTAPPESATRLAAAFGEVTDLRQAPSRTCLAVYLNDELVLDELAGESLLPASLVKVATASAFLDLAGAGRRFTTEVFAATEALENVTDGAAAKVLQTMYGILA